jgi:hypothetical protein
MKKKLLLEKIAASKNDIAEAELRMTKVIRAVDVAPRAEKRTVSEAVSEAIEKLTSARKDLEALEKLVLEGD